MYRYLASEEKKDVDYIFYGRDMDQSLCAHSAHKLPHSRGALCIFPIGKTLFFFKKRGKECYSWEWVRSGCWLMADHRVRGDVLSTVVCMQVCFSDDELFTPKLTASVDLCKCWISSVSIEIPAGQRAEVTPAAAAWLDAPASVQGPIDSTLQQLINHRSV